MGQQRLRFRNAVNIDVQIVKLDKAWENNYGLCRNRFVGKLENAQIVLKLNAFYAKQVFTAVFAGQFKVKGFLAAGKEGKGFRLKLL